MACRRISQNAAMIILPISYFLLLFSGASIFFFQQMYNKILKEDIALTNGSLITKIWEDIPLPIYEKLYFFNITNQEAYLKGVEPLNVTEVGPYTYKSRWVKPNPQWNDNHTVSYTETRTYEFMASMSTGSENDRIFTLNGPMIIGAKAVPVVLRSVFYWYCKFTGEEVIIEKSIKELAYQGYEDEIIKRAWIFKPDLPYKDGTFSWLYGKNATNDGLYTVFTGEDDETKTNFITRWNGNEKLSYWDDDSCNMINGTTVETGPPIKNHQDSYTFFQSFFCRSVTFNYVEDTKHYGITSKRFKPTYQIFANSTENPENYCFEVNKQRASGLLDLSRCQFGAPVFISFPHFHLADPSYLRSVNGLSPSEDKHGSYMDVEPITGLSIDMAVKFQINIEIEEVSGFYFFDTVPKGVFPIFWAELSLKIDEDLASFLNHKVRDPKIIAYTLISIVILIGCIGMVLSITVLLTYNPEENKPLLFDDEQFPERSINYNDSNAAEYDSRDNIQANIDANFHKNDLDK